MSLSTLPTQQKLDNSSKSVKAHHVNAFDFHLVCCPEQGMMWKVWVLVNLQKRDPAAVLSTPRIWIPWLPWELSFILHDSPHPQTPLSLCFLLWASLPGHLGFPCFLLSFLYSCLSHYLKPFLFLFGENMPVLSWFLYTRQLDRWRARVSQPLCRNLPLLSLTQYNGALLKKLCSGLGRCQERWHHPNPGAQSLHKASQCTERPLFVAVVEEVTDIKPN